MDDRTLQRVIDSDFFLKRMTMGIYSRDEIPPHLPAGKAMIVNTGNSGQKEAAHWLTVSNVRKRNLDVLDSCKTKLKTMPLLQRLIDRSDKKLYLLPFILQDCHETHVCGAWTLWFLYVTSRGFSPPEMMSRFFSKRSEKAFKRDVFISELIPRLLPTLKTSPRHLLQDPQLIREEEEEEKKKKKKKKKV